jgi:hypothetical protein
MQFSSVTFVLAEAILGEPGAKVTHHPVARYLGDHAGGGDALTDAIAIDNRSLRKRKRNDRQPIDQDVIWRIDQGCDRQTHCSMARAQDIDAIDLYRIDNADRPLDFGIAHKIRIDLFAQFRSKLLGIIQPTMTKFFRKNHRCGDNGTCQCTAARFVNPRDACDAGGAQFFLVTKSASPVHVRNLMTRRFNDLTNSLNHSITKSRNDLSFAHSRRFLAFAGTKVI